MARSPKTIGLALPRTLQSNSKEDIQEFLEKWMRKFNLMYELLLSDITTVEIGGGTSDDWLYFGGKNAVDSVRIGKVSGTTEFLIQHYIAGVYTSRFGTDV